MDAPNEKENTGIKTIPRGRNQSPEKREFPSHHVGKRKAHDTG
jgi:hypothetical protein